jgi:hypothetical protein
MYKKLELTLMLGKLIKRVVGAVNKDRTDVRKLRKLKELGSSKSTVYLNRAQERVETAKDVKNITLSAMKRIKIPTEGREAFKTTFDKVVRKRAGIRNILRILNTLIKQRIY